MKRRKKSFATRVEFTERDFQIIRWVCAGKVNKEIGVELGVSKSRVVALVSSLYKRAGVDNRVEFAVWAAKRGLC